MQKRTIRLSSNICNQVQVQRIQTYTVENEEKKFTITLIATMPYRQLVML